MKLIRVILLTIIAVINPFKSNSQSITFNNPIAEQRADPWVHKTDSGEYYLIATVPEYDRIVIRRANSINGLKEAKDKEVWHKHEKGVMGSHIWAPELHRIDGKWYIYFAAGESENIWNIRIWVLSNPSVVILTEPEFSWEREKYNVNEGPAVIKKNGKIFVTYSASATNHNYCMGLLWIDENTDLLNIANWQKSPGPVFYTNEELKRYGPGHNSFTTSEDGKSTIMIYHARDYKEIQGHELSDKNRATRARVVEFTKSGFPDFMQNKND